MANIKNSEKQEVIYEESILTGEQTHASVHKTITDIVLARPLEKGWLFALSIALAGLLTLVISIAWLVKRGIGIWGNINPVGWAFDIINFSEDHPGPAIKLESRLNGELMLTVEAIEWTVGPR